MAQKIKDLGLFERLIIWWVLLVDSLGHPHDNEILERQLATGVEADSYDAEQREHLVVKVIFKLRAQRSEFKPRA